MKNWIYKFILLVCLGLSTYSCGLFKNLFKNTDNGQTTVMTAPGMYGQTMLINARQLDSVCVVDGLSTDLEKWLVMTFYDYETGEKIDRYAFVKIIGQGEELTYILTPRDTLYEMTKRFVKEIVEEDE